MINSVVLVGRLTRDAELRRTTSGAAVASFTLALDNGYKGPNGERTTSFIPCTVWGQSAENTVKYTHKGSLVGVTGRLNQRSYESKDGRKVQVVEVVCNTVQFLETKNASTESNRTEPEPMFEEDSDTNKDEGMGIELSDDDLPF